MHPSSNPHSTIHLTQTQTQEGEGGGRSHQQSTPRRRRHNPSSSFLAHHEEMGEGAVRSGQQGQQVSGGSLIQPSFNPSSNPSSNTNVAPTSGSSASGP